MNSLVKTPKGGMPRIARLPSARPQPIVGLVWTRPRIESMFCVPATCEAWPQVKKIALLVSECTVMCRRPANAATAPPMPKAKVMIPMCSIDIKRMFAYSSIEHMGIMTFAFGMGGAVAAFAGLLHMTVHSLTKSAIFFTVGHASQVAGTQHMDSIRGLVHTSPTIGWVLALGSLT